MCIDGGLTPILRRMDSDCLSLGWRPILKAPVKSDSLSRVRFHSRSVPFSHSQKYASNSSKLRFITIELTGLSTHQKSKSQNYSCYKTPTDLSSNLIFGPSPMSSSTLAHTLKRTHGHSNWTLRTNHKEHTWKQQKLVTLLEERAQKRLYECTAVCLHTVTIELNSVAQILQAK